MFQSFEEYKNATSSEKLALVLMYPRQGITTFELVGGYIWKKTISVGIINALFTGSTSLTVAASSSVTDTNPWYFNISTNELYFYTESTSPDDDNVIGEFVLHFSNAPLNLSWNLTDTGKEVCYEPRVLSTVGFKSEIGSDQKGISITGAGTVSLQNNDGFFDAVYDSFIWENKKVEIYSYNRDLSPSDAQLQYKGFIVNRSFNLEKVSFKIQDAIFKLDTKIPMNLFTLVDGVGESFVGNTKRQVYGKVDGLLCRSLDQVGTGRALTGTVSGTAASTTIIGSSTLFLTELAMNDTITVGSNTYTVLTIASNTSMTISETEGLNSTFVAQACTVVPSISSPEYNRTFFIADHAISQQTTTITSMPQLNRFSVVTTEGFEVGDNITVDGNSHTIFNISGFQIQISINAAELYAVGAVVTKEPLSQIFVNGVEIAISDLDSVVNTTYSSFTISKKAEFNITPNQLINDANFAFTNGSNQVVYSGTKDLSNTFQERDWIKAEGHADTAFIRIAYIDGNNIYCSSTYTGATASSKKAVKRRPEYITDDSSVSINCRGRTVDGTATGDLIETSADVVKQLLIDIGLEDDLDLASFASASIDNCMRVSLAIPYEITTPAPNVKDIINDLNKTVFGSLFLKQDLSLAYLINSPERESDIEIISDDDIIRWSMTGAETNSYKRILGRYKFIDYDNTKKQKGNSLVDYSSDKVIDYDISNKETDQNFRVYNETDATELVERFIHYNEQILTEVVIESDLRLTHLEIGDKVILNFNRFISQPSIGDTQKVFIITGINKNINTTEITLSDLGNLFNRSAVVSDNDSLDYDSSTEEERRFTSYFTDDNGLVTDYDESKNTNIIS